MFEEVSKPRLARRLVGRADLVPDHMRDDRRAMIGNHYDLETVRQRKMGDLGADAGLRGSGEHYSGQRGNGEDRSVRHELALVGLSPPRCHVPARERERKPPLALGKCGWDVLSRKVPCGATAH